MKAKVDSLKRSTDLTKHKAKNQTNKTKTNPKQNKKSEDVNS